MATTKDIKVTVYQYKYFIHPILITVPERQEPIFIENKRIKGILIDRDFDQNIMPIVDVEFVINKKDYLEVIEKMNKCTLRLKIDKVRWQEGMKQFDREPYIDNVYNFMTDNIQQNNSPVIDKKLEQDLENTENGPSTSPQIFTIKVSCFDNVALKGFKKTVNIVSSSVNPAGAIGFIINQAKFPLSMIAPPDNKGNKRLIMPESNIQEAFEYIHTNIGIYNSGYRIFYDIDKTFYFLAGDPKSNCFRENEVKNIYIDAHNNAHVGGLAYGSYVDEENTLHIRMDSTNITYKSKSAAFKELRPTKIKTIGGDVLGDTKGDVDGFDSGENVLVIDNKRNNDYYIKSLLFKTRTGKLKAYVRILEGDLTQLTPNKMYYINYINNLELNTKYSGLYKINRIITTLERESDLYRAITAIELMK